MTKPSRPLVERARGAGRVVVAGGQRAHRAEAADERLVDAGLGPAGDHHLGVAARMISHASPIAWPPVAQADDREVRARGRRR
jgi:hypothetical protein